MNTTGRLLVVEDDPRLGPIMERVLGASWDVRLVTSAEDALGIVDERYFDAMVVDRRLPGMDGAELVATLRSRRVSTPMIMLTAAGETRDKISGLDSGANDYMVKPFDFEELEARLRALTRNYATEGEAVPIGEWTFYPESSTVHSPYTGRIGLTEKENALLRMLSAEPTRVFTREQILDVVFSNADQVGTVDTYVHYVRRKTDKEMIQTVRGSGYRIGTP
jgi:two-component system, OmpR family, response regulator QseB